MNPFNGILEQGKKIWNATTPGARVLMVIVMSLSLISIVGVGIWSSRPNYVTLESNLEPKEAQELVSKLVAVGISSKTNYSGSAVLVPSAKLGKARIAAGDLLSSTSSSPGGLSGFPSMSGSEGRHRYWLKTKEAELKRSIEKMPFIKSADVHIAQPKPNPFVRSQEATTASIVVGLKSNAILSRAHASSISHMVAGSVEGLSPKSVTISDLNGNSWSPDSPGDNEMFGQLEYTRQIEAGLVYKAESMLRRRLGEDKAFVQVSAEIDFTSRTRSAKAVDPTGSKSQETIDSSQKTDTSGDPSGIAGASSNLAVSGQGNSGTQNSDSKETITTTWVVGESNEVVEDAPGKIKRLTISAVVDLSGQAAGGQQPDIAKIEEIIKTAVGFDATRNDQITVSDGPIPKPADDGEEIIAGVNRWEFISTMVRNSSLGLAAVVALIVLQLALRKMKPVTIVVDPEEDIRRQRALSSLSTQIQQNPEAVSKILSTWLRDVDTPGSEPAKAA